MDPSYKEKTEVKITLNTPKHASPYGSTQSVWGMDGNKNTQFHTQAGVGQYWTAAFTNGPWSVTKVKIQNRSDGYTDRLSYAKIEIDGQLCGSLGRTSGGGGKWYEVRCSKKLVGRNVKVVMTRHNYLHFAHIEVYGSKNGWSDTGDKFTWKVLQDNTNGKITGLATLDNQSH